ncbi:phospholipase/carboxylesterase [Rhodoblastus acidophilus]|uniref:alpha/beta hydrolase n=1 Tax=Rhodoblastus acidophilus TaxID=1074 RepID=UPI0022247C86|nr:dienelactone hydrolase family protein [Rhodoblastus acidophilus]MCW2282484.1 phospholipase/carboxylesterase [Rhodoblastus acidophilus]MCW2331111.1 phospholipase/carboxylesterase [Rhodoblastus acidophilus]
MARPLIILLHGVNADGANLDPLRVFLAEHLPGVDVVAPDAPFPTPFGFQWFSLDDITPENRRRRIVGARTAFDAVLRALVAGRNRVGLCGFSQGGMMALDALVTGRWPLLAVAGFSTRLASPPPFTPTQAPVLIIHGDADSVIPAAEGVAAAEALRALKLDVRSHVLPGVDHCITPEGMGLAAAFFGERLLVA